MIDEKKKVILVTGGAGFIGSHLVDLLNKTGEYRIEVVDNFSESRNNVIKSPRVTYHEVDIRDKDRLMEVFLSTKPGIVFNFASLILVSESMTKPFEYFDTNIIGGINILECMRTTGVTKIVFSSSAAVYGEPLTEEIKENHTKNPTNTYGYTKLVFENFLKDYNRAYGFSSISLRYFCAAGCDIEAGLGEYHTPETHVIPAIIETLLGKRKEFFVFGGDFSTPDGTAIRDYIHVSDLVKAHILAMEKIFDNENICTQYNLGLNKGFSVTELIKAAEEVTGRKLNYSFKERRPGDPSRLVANSQKARDELGWIPKYTEVKDIISSSYEFFKTKK